MVIFLLIVIAIGVLLISETGKNILGLSIGGLLVLGKFLFFAGVLGLLGYVLYEVGFGIILVLLGLGFWGLVLGLLGGKKKVVNLENKEEETEGVFVAGQQKEVDFGEATVDALHLESEEDGETEITFMPGRSEEKK